MFSSAEQLLLQLHSGAKSGKADEMPQGKFRPLDPPEGRRRLEHAHGKKQHQKAVADPYQGIADSRNDSPYFAALKGCRRLGNEFPQLCQLPVPVFQSPFQCAYDPIVNQTSPPVCFL